MAALIIAVTPFRRRAVDVSHSDLLPRLECSLRGFLTSTWPVSFSRQTAHHYPFQPPSSTTLILPLALIFISGGGRRSRSCVFRLVFLAAALSLATQVREPRR